MITRYLRPAAAGRRRWTARVLGAGLAVLLAAVSGCWRQPTIRQVGEPAAQTWADTIDFPALGLRVQLEKGRALFRDDGLFRGDLSLHTRDLQAEPGLAGLAGAGKLSEGLVAVATGPDGVRRAVVYALATDHPADDEARREGLRAAAAIRLGRRADLERFFLSQGIRLPMRTTGDGVLAAMVEVYALARAGRPIQWLDGADRQQAAAMLMARGIGEP